MNIFIHRCFLDKFFHDIIIILHVLPPQIIHSTTRHDLAAARRAAFASCLEGRLIDDRIVICNCITHRRLIIDDSLDLAVDGGTIDDVRWRLDPGEAFIRGVISGVAWPCTLGR